MEEPLQVLLGFRFAALRTSPVNFLLPRGVNNGFVGINRLGRAFSTSPIHGQTLVARHSPPPTVRGPGHNRFPDKNILGKTAACASRQAAIFTVLPSR